MILTETWNTALISPDRELTKRDYVYASELGRPMVDRWLRMNAVPYTNPPNDRSKRKFFSGDVWEWLVWTVFNLSGIVKSRQDVVEVTDGALKVRGKLDFLIGGTPNRAAALTYLNTIPYPASMRDFFERVILQLSETPIEDCICEAKSLSSFAFERILEKGAYDNHCLQLYHYSMGMNLPGVLSYVCRDDARLKEFTIDIEDAGLKMDYYFDLKMMADYLNRNEQPPNEPLITFDGKFQKNLRVEYSAYLTHVYGFKEPEDYRLAVDGKVQRWNRVLNRMKLIKEGKTTPTGKEIKLTLNNEAALTEMRLDGWEPEILLNDFKTEEENE